VCRRAALPKPPTSLVVTDVTANSARLTWNSGNTDPVQSYVVQYRHKYSTDGLFDEIFDVATTEYTVLGLNAHTVYEFRVVAVNAIGRSLPSTPVDVTTGELGMSPHPVLCRVYLGSESRIYEFPSGISSD